MELARFQSKLLLLERKLALMLLGMMLLYRNVTLFILELLPLKRDCKQLHVLSLRIRRLRLGSGSAKIARSRYSS